MLTETMYFPYFFSLVFPSVPFIFFHLLDNQQALHKINTYVSHQFVQASVPEDFRQHTSDWVDVTEEEIYRFIY